MSSSEFKQNFSKLIKNAGDKMELVVRRTALELQSQLIERTPVDAGRAKSNWQAGIGAVNPATGAPAGEDATGRTATALESWKPGQTIWLTNSLPYMRALENGLYGKPPGSANGPKTVAGYSQQAPAGIVALTTQNYAQAVKKAVSESK